MSSSHTLFIDNGAYEIRAILDKTNVLPTQPNIAFKLPADSTAANPATSLFQVAAGGTDLSSSSASSSSKFAVGDQIYKLPFSVLCRSRGRRPLGLHSILVDAGLQARIWRHLIYSVAGLLSEENVDLIVTIQPGTPKESAVLWYTLCFVFFKFKSVTFVSSGWVRYLGTIDTEDETTEKQPATGKKQTTKKSSSSTSKQEKQSKTLEIAFLLDVGFSGISCFPIINHLPQRRGFIQQHLGLNHVGKFLGRLISFTQMDIVRGGTPELLVQKGIMEKCLQVSSSCDSLHEHLMLWEKAWLKLSHAGIPDSTLLKKIMDEAKEKDVLYQGSLRRRLRSRDVPESITVGQEISTMWYSLPSYEDEIMMNTSSSNSSHQNNSKRQQQMMNARLASMFGKVVANRFGHSKSSKEDDENGDEKEQNFESESEEEDSDDDEGGRNNNTEPDDTVLRIDHERFIAAEILFHPRQVVGEANGGRLTAAFGSGHSLIGVLTATSASSNNTNNNIDHHFLTDSSGGCVEAVHVSMKRFGPEALLQSSSMKLVCCGGGSKIRGFTKRIEKDLSDSTPTTRIECCCTEAEDYVLLTKACSNVLCSTSVADTDADDGKKVHQQNIAKFLTTCRVHRIDEIESLFKSANTTSQKKSAHENAVEVVFRAMQNILV